MIDRWFIDDINGALCNCGRAVVTDAHEEGKFLLDFLPNDVVLLEIASSDLDEIKAKYEDGVLKLTMPKKTETLPKAHHLEIE